MRQSIFDKKNLNLFCYGGDGIEFFHSIIFSLGYTNKELNNPKAREQALIAIRELMNIKVIEVQSWGKHNVSDTNWTVSQRMKEIEKIWIQGSDFADFFDMVTFKLSDWYFSALEELGMKETINWYSFVEENIEDIEKFIEQKRPK